HDANLRGEQEHGSTALDSVTHDEISWSAVRVEHSAGRQSARDSDDKRILRERTAVHVALIERRRAAAVVRHPERAAPAHADAPRVDEIGIRDEGNPWLVRNQVRLMIDAGRRRARASGGCRWKQRDY